MFRMLEGKYFDACKFAEKITADIDIISRRCKGNLKLNATEINSIIVRALRVIPSEEVAPIVYAEWVESSVKDSMLSECTRCHFNCGAPTFKYCPMCGATIRRERGNNETN